MIKASMVQHQTGIRPTTINRKPLIGAHPGESNLYCFNGFGSKGCLSIPYFAKQFSQHFSQGLPQIKVLPELNPLLEV